jgi:fibronectin type 3 domain-containing protein
LRRTDPTAVSEKPVARTTIGPDVASGATLGDNGAYDPAYLQSAYNAPASTKGAGQTVAIVDAYDDPSAAADLTAYRSEFGLSACTTSNGCFRKVNEKGGTSYPTGNTSWGQEISLDLDMVSAICPNCHILLVEASTTSIADLGASVNEAVALGATVVSNSYGGPEYSGETSDSTRYYNHPGVAITVAAGDDGYGTEFPATSSTVTAVGGTTLNQLTNTGTRNATETVWTGTGSGCSAYVAKPSFQPSTGCARRAVNDVSAVADPNTGVWVYDSYGGGSWLIFGGTSVATPIVGAMYALAGNAKGSTQLNALPYADTSALNDVTSGSNGTCSVSQLCNSAVGYDGPTGLGTPNGIAAFSLAGGASQAAGAPTGLTATGTAGQVALSWTAPTSSGGSAITGYAIYRKTSSGAETLLATAGTGTTYTDTAVSAGSTYFYDVAAVNGSGPGAKSAEMSAAVPAATITVPGAPTGLTASTSVGSVVLSWKAPSSTGGSAITSYNVYRGTATGAETLKASGVTTTSYTDTTVTGGTKYFYEVTAVNAKGESARSSELSATPPVVTAPGAPVGVTATGGTGSVSLSWGAPSNNGGAAIGSYDIYRSTSSGREVLYASGVSGTSFTDVSVSRGTVYYYEVAAVNTAGVGTVSNQVSGTPTQTNRGRFF